ncbi:alkyl/aryl-sulfatase [Peribacillus frigoritolerans]|uniref:alkyl/aryl-sulfatase n=1 Tax=Peribacillus frigoritolerans TaxID=450367 RepID=UPI0020BE4C5F|nr:alkyl sulfatase dimerization domain-containing protein [Peribacillus frigoritolerans]
MTRQGISQSNSATSFTKKSHEEVYQYLDFEAKQDFEDARRGFIAPFETNIIREDGNVVWDSERLSFLEGTAPDTVNPSLWRNSQLHRFNGLFKVVDGVYQVRGQSVCTTIFIEGKTGVIVCDASTSNETAKAAMELYYTHRPNKPVTAIIFSQSHVDHWGGVQEVLRYAENPKIPIIAPEHFTKEALSENVLLGTIMSRRVQYQMGTTLPAGPNGYVSAGVGHILGSGHLSFEVPNIDIKNEVETMVVDGITFTFLLTPNTEAPVEMHFYIQDYNALFVSENSNKTMHQIYTVRGAKTRDALAWANAIDKTIDLFANVEIDALLMIHAWPVWGKERALEHLKLQRDMYKYMHDQTVRLANHGYTMDEIAEIIKLPESLDRFWANRGYYGTLKHNSKGIYNFYLGYYSAHPSDLDPLPQVESGHKFVQYMGGAAKVLKQAKADFEKGEYRWVAQVLKHVVMADPENIEAKHLLADAFEQLGYQAESANWRNMYLVGASELRNGRGNAVLNTSNIALKMPVKDFLMLLAVKLNGPKADGKKITINVTLSDLKQNYVLFLENSVLNIKANKVEANADVSLVVDKLTFYSISLGSITPEQAITSGRLHLTGDQNKLNELLSLLDEFTTNLNIVTP